VATQPARDLLVFLVRRATKCGDCQADLPRGDFIHLHGEDALCLDCAGLGYLEFLPRGDTALTRRATKYSELVAVVLEWSRSRKRYERQGILAEEAAIRRAEEECLADSELRLRRQAHAAERRDAEDKAYVAAFASALRALYPRCPAPEAESIARHACAKYSGRVGRTASAKALDPAAVRMATVAHVRHTHTDYDRLLAMSLDRVEARSLVRDKIEAILQTWSGN
jgi:hypothetical protein